MIHKHAFAFAAVLLGVGLGPGSRTAHATTILKIATLAPAESPWGKEYKKWAKAVAADTNGELELDFQWNGQAGDEALMVQKVRSGQLDGVGITATGLAQTGVADVLIFQMPGLFATWSKLDVARDGVKDELNKEFEAKGFTVGGWGDVGAAKVMTVGFEVHHPADLRGKACTFTQGDVVQPALFAAIGGITPKQLQISELLPALGNGTANVLIAPSLGAEQLQWASRITHISSLTAGFGIGALIWSSARYQSIPQNLKNVLEGRGLETRTRMTATIRNLDAQSYARLKTSKSAYELTDGEKKEWADLFASVRLKLRGNPFTPSMFDKITQLAQ